MTAAGVLQAAALIIFAYLVGMLVGRRESTRRIIDLMDAGWCLRILRDGPPSTAQMRDRLDGIDPEIRAIANKAMPENRTWNT